LLAQESHDILYGFEEIVVLYCRAQEIASDYQKDYRHH